MLNANNNNINIIAQPIHIHTHHREGTKYQTVCFIENDSIQKEMLKTQENQQEIE